MASANPNHPTKADVLLRAEDRLVTARQILAELRLLERWSAFGKPVVVGAVAYGLVVAPDIDIEIFCEEPGIAQGFDVLAACAQHPRARKARFSNHLDDQHMGLYWQLRYLQEAGQEWKIDMWAMRSDHPGPLSAALVAPMNEVLSDETRQIILELKEQALLEPRLQCGSIHIYRAVLDDGIRSVEQFRKWLEHPPAGGLTTCKPGAERNNLRQAGK